MQSQVKKLAVICNACFWLTIVFKYWKNARDIQQDVLNTILILGMAAIVANVVWLILVVTKNTRKTEVDESTAISTGIARKITSGFNLISLLAQAYYMVVNFL